MIDQFSTARLQADKLRPEDALFVQELVNTKGWLQFIGDRNVHSIDDAVAYINRILSSPTIHYWVVRLTDSNTPIGVVTFLKRDYLEHWDIGFAFLPEHNGEGYALEASKKLLSTMREFPEHDVVLATTLPANTSSIKLLKKLGMQFDKEIVNAGEILHLYSISS